MNSPGGEPRVGSIGEEAAKLLQALQEWATDTSRDGSGTSEATGGVGGWLGNLGQHVATGERECTYCPICRVISAARATSPEVKQHLAVATYSLVQACSGMLAPLVHGGDADAAGGPVEHIDVERPDEGGY